MRRIHRIVVALVITSQLTLNHAWTVPDRLRLNVQGQPRLTSVITCFVNAATRVCLCLPSSTKEFNIQVCAQSNRAVLEGKIDQLSIHVKESESAWLNINQFDLQSVNLELGLRPLLFASAPILFTISRPFRILVAMYTYFFIIGKIWSNTATNTHAFLTKVQSIRNSIQHVLGGKRCRLDYNLILTDKNLDESMLLRRGLKSVLQYLMENSVLKAAATAGDTAQIIINENENALDSPGLKKEPSFKLTRLLSATSFELKETPIFTNGRLVMPSQAVTPDGGTQSRLDFTLRTSVKGGKSTLENLPRHQNVLQFANPECRFDVTAASLPSVIGNLLPPVLWLPVGSGVAFPLGKRHDLKRVSITNGTCQINGRISFFESYNDTENQNLLRGARDFFLGSSKSLPSLKAAKSNREEDK